MAIAPWPSIPMAARSGIAIMPFARWASIDFSMPTLLATRNTTAGMSAMHRWWSASSPNSATTIILLVYGDHLPALNPVYAQLGFRDERRPEEQPVPWLLVDNRSHEPRVQN